MKRNIALRTSGTGLEATLTLDGQDIARYVTGLNLSIDAKTHMQHLELYLIPGALDVELRDTDVFIDARTHDLLVRLGWTPPTEDKEATG